MLLDNKEKCNSPNPDFIYDEACLDIINTLDEDVEIWGQYVECVGCDFIDYGELLRNNSKSLLINTKYSIQMYYTVKGQKDCNWSAELFEHYRYGWNITKPCSSIYIKNPADNAYLPILTAFIILFIFGTMWYMIKGIYKCTRNNDLWQRYLMFTSEIQSDLGTPSDNAPLVVERPPSVSKHPNRMKSIDVFRGLCIILMIFVNYGGGQYWFFKHSVWNGVTVADLVFPWFIYVMGLSYSISLNKKLHRAVPRRQLIIQVIRRSFILILLGVVLNSHGKISSLSSLRYPGVLQHLGLVYFFVGMIESVFGKRSLTVEDYGRMNIFRDLIMAWPQWLIVISCLFVHTCITFFVDIPGCGRGYLGPGGLHDGGKYINCTGGVAGYLDRFVFGEHMYTKPTCHIMYETTLYFDPEGILGTLTSVFLAYLGVQAGRILNAYNTLQGKIIRLVLWGVTTCLLGGILCNFAKNGGLIPINKNLWSLSFVLALGGMGFLLQTFLYVIVDIKQKWGGRPFFYPGMNPLILYVGHELFKNTFPFAWIPGVKSHAAYLGMNLWGTILWIAISIFLYKKNIFLHI